MIERLLIENQLSFKQCDLNFTKGLIAFSGPSGAGKSVLMQAVLSLFGQSEPQASKVEATINHTLDLEPFGLQSDEPNIFKYTKTNNARYFINLQSISKKSMSQISNSFVNYLSVKDNEEFENERLITLLDALIGKEKDVHVKELSVFKNTYEQYKLVKKSLDNIEAKEKKIEELKEFTAFEIEKIDEVSPKVGEDEELLKFKRDLSKKEKIQEAIDKAFGVFEFESSITEVFALLQMNGSFFDDNMNELRAILEDEQQRMSELDEIDVDELLDRIEKISTLKNRYGTIEDILAYREKKKEELNEYENISFKKEHLKKETLELFESSQILAQNISKRRISYLKVLNDKINEYLKMLYMPNIALKLKLIDLYEFGVDCLSVELGNVNVKKISSGEYNRLRLAFIATTSEYMQKNGGVLILDEIDANLSGKESMSVAKVLKNLSQKYQIFAISHQPQLSSQADLHFLVTKNGQISEVTQLNEEQRVKELARMVSGDEVSEEAINLANALLLN